MEEFEKAALFLRLGLPSTLIRHENGIFRKFKCSSSRRNLKTPALRFGVNFPAQVFLKNKSKSSVVWTENV